VARRSGRRAGPRIDPASAAAGEGRTPSRAEPDVEITRQPKTLPYVPAQDEIRRYYQTVWQGRRTGDVVLIKTLLYTGVRVAELVALRLDDVDLYANRVWVNLGKGGKDRQPGVGPAPLGSSQLLLMPVRA